MAKIVLFIDALDRDDLGATRFSNTLRGRLESGAPKVTPKVTSEVQTGLSPTHTNFGGQHSMKGERNSRPHAPMLPEKLERAGYDVLHLYMPYSHPPQIQNGAFVSDTMEGPQPGPNPMAQACVEPPATGDLMDPDDDGEFAWNTRTDQIYGRSSNMLNAIRAADFDVAFLGIRSPDQYTHFQWGEGWREKLVEDIAHEIERWEVNHDVLWWSDHGNEEKKETFRVNRWLMEKGYLDVDIDMEFHERFTDEMEQMNPQAGVGRSIENQLNLQAPGVEVGEGTQAMSNDPYDSCIDIVDEDLDPQSLAEDMMDTGHYDRVVPTEEEWGDGPFIDQCPDLVTLRADNVLVTGNIHPEPIGMGFHRDGVHSKYGVWGTTDDSFAREGPVTPREFHDVVLEFVTGSSTVGDRVQDELNRMREQMQAVSSE